MPSRRSASHARKISSRVHSGSKRSSASKGATNGGPRNGSGFPAFSFALSGSANTRKTQTCRLLSRMINSATSIPSSWLAVVAISCPMKSRRKKRSFSARTVCSAAVITVSAKSANSGVFNRSGSMRLRSRSISATRPVRKSFSRRFCRWVMRPLTNSPMSAPTSGTALILAEM